MKQLGNVRAIFKIDRNLDFHLGVDDEAAAEAKVDAVLSKLLNSDFTCVHSTSGFCCVVPADWA